MKVAYLGPESKISHGLGLLGLPPGEEDSRKALEELFGADVIVCYRYRRIIPEEFINSFPGRIINIHTSLLPNCRGAHPVFWAFMEGALHGVTIHEVDRGVDTGPVIAQLPIVLHPALHTFRTAWERVNDIAQRFFLALWPKLLDAEPQPQSLWFGTEHRKREIEKYGDLSWDVNVREWLERDWERGRR